jgi:hypothetical protein
MCTATVAARGDAAVSRSGEVTGVASGARHRARTAETCKQMVRADRAIRAATLPSGFRVLTLKLVYANVGQEPTIRSFRPKRTFWSDPSGWDRPCEEDGNGN